jgi:hypothetical protein
MIFLVIKVNMFGLLYAYFFSYEEVTRSKLLIESETFEKDWLATFGKIFQKYI